MLVLQVIVFLWSFSSEICANIGQGNVVSLTGKVREFCFGRLVGTLRLDVYRTSAHGVALVRI